MELGRDGRILLWGSGVYLLEGYDLLFLKMP